MKLVRRAEKGDAQAMSELRETVGHDGAWDSFADMVTATEEAQIKAIAGDNLIFAESLKRQVARLKAELGGPACTPMERLIVDRIAVCWLQTNYADAIYAQGQKDLSIRQGEYYQRRQDRAQRRFLSAIKSLAYVRKLPLAVLQVNIDKQVNIAGGPPPEPQKPTARVVSASEAYDEAQEEGTAPQNGLLEEGQN